MSAASNIQAPLRVLHVYAGNLYGGIETFLRTLAEERHQCPEMEPEFALCFEGRLADEIRASGAPLHMLGGVRMSRPWTVLRAQAKLRAVIKSRRPDVVVCHAPWPLTIFGPVVRLAKARLVFYRHDIGGKRDWINVLAAHVRPDLIIANSEYTAKNGYPVFPGVESRTLFYVLRAPSKRISAAERAELRRKLGAREDDVVILQASRMQAWKGQALLIDALALLPSAIPWKCWLAGDAQRDLEKAYVSSLRASAAAHGISDRIHFLGQRSDVSNLMAAADIFCQPNVAPEPFGIVFVEALDAGLPLVTTDAAGGALEILDPDCSLTPAANSAAIAKAICTLAEDPHLRSQLSSRAISQARELTKPAIRLAEVAAILGSRSGHLHDLSEIA